MQITDLKRMFDEAEVELTYEQVALIFGMSKQIVINDAEDEGQAKL